MPLFQLNRLQKNQLHEVIRTNGLNPQKFHWGEFRREFISFEALLCESDSGKFYFAFDFSDGQFGTVMKPVIDGYEYLQSSSWNGILSAFARWLSLVRAEWEEPDLWNAPFAAAIPEKATDSSKLRRFTQSEIKQLKRALKEVQKKVQAQPQFDKRNAEKLSLALDYLAEKAETETIFDWKNICLGTLATIWTEPWLAPVAQDFRDAVTHHLMPLLNGLLGLH